MVDYSNFRVPITVDGALETMTIELFGEEK
jgi:hypothetical protein